MVIESPYKDNIDALVLGCTHYPFIKKEIRDVLGDVKFYDGAHGTAVNLMNHLIEENKLNTSDEKGMLFFESSSGSEETYKKFLWHDPEQSVRKHKSG